MSPSERDAGSRSSAAEGPRRIKRYANRKLYDTAERGFTSLAAVRDLVRAGVEVRVVDHRTGVDRTEETLALALGVRGSGVEGAAIPAVSDLIRYSGRLARTVLGDATDDEAGNVDDLRALRDEVEALSRRIDSMLARSVDGGGDGTGDEPGHENGRRPAGGPTAPRHGPNGHRASTPRNGRRRDG